jgi:hypothetical protein
VEQDDPTAKQAGIAALPMNLAQCSAVISIIDEQYYERSWCSIEVMMIQTLRKAYALHLWLEDVINPVTGQHTLREGPKDLEINMAKTKVTYENDWQTLMFLQRQARLLA